MGTTDWLVCGPAAMDTSDWWTCWHRYQWLVDMLAWILVIGEPVGMDTRDWPDCGPVVMHTSD